MKKNSKIFWIGQIKKHIGIIIFLICASGAMTILKFISPVLIQRFLDAIASQSIKVQNLLSWVLMIFLSLLLERIISFLFNYFSGKVVITSINELKNHIHVALMKTSYISFQSVNNSVSNTIMNDVNGLMERGIAELIQMVLDIIVAIISIVFLMRLHYAFVLGCVFLAVIGVWISDGLNKRQHTFIEKAQFDEQRQTNYIMDFFDRPLFFKTHYKLSYATEKFRDIATTLLKSSLKRELNFRWVLVVTVSLNALMTAYIYGLGGYLFATNRLTIGGITLAVSLTRYISMPIQSSVHYYFSLKELGPRIRRINSLLDLEPEENENVSLQTNSILPKSIRFDNVALTYGEYKVFERISFTLVQGQHCILSGGSGTGKTSIFNLLLALTSPTAGEIYIQKHPYGTLPKETIRNFFSIATQEPFFFRGTILENLTVVNPHSTPHQIKRALFLSASDEFISNLPNGLNTVLETNALNISGGQRQRLSIARALLANRPYLLLDEATSALEPDLERKVLSRLLKDNKMTVILITHSHINHDLWPQTICLTANGIKDE